MKTIGFIGLGNMGGPMAANLLKAGFKVKGFDLAPSMLEKFSSAGGIPVQHIEEAARNVDTVITMLPTGRHVESVYCSSNDLLNIIDDHTVVIDTSTIDADTTKRIADCAHKKGISFLDAPVSGGVSGAIDGTLTFIVGGDKSTLEKARPLFDAMGTKIFHAGAVGSGQISKACNNMLLAILMAGTAEALALGKANGLDVSVLSEIMKNSSGNNWALQLYNPAPGVMQNAPSSNSYQGGFAIKLMLKDLDLALSNAKDNQAIVPMGSLARNLFSIHRNNSNEDLDFSSIYQLFQSYTKTCF